MKQFFCGTVQEAYYRQSLSAILGELHVRCEIIDSVSIDSCSTSSLVENGGILFVKVVNQNGTAGHCIVIDLFKESHF